VASGGMFFFFIIIIGLGTQAAKKSKSATMAANRVVMTMCLLQSLPVGC